jgi:tripartite ATP-independent transporter DctP family solute receptor
LNESHPVPPDTRRWLWWLAFVPPLALLLQGLYIGAVAETSHTKLLRLGHSLSQDHPVHTAMLMMAERVKESSDGSLRIEVYADGQLGPERELIEMLQIGSLAMTKVSTGPLESFSPRVAVLALPYLFRDREHFWKTMDGEIGQELLAVSVPFGLKGLAYYDAGARSFYVNRKTQREITTPDDLTGLSIRVMKTQTAIRMVELLGAKPVPIPFGELYSALDSGTVDGAENNPPSLFTTRQYEVCSSYALDEHSRVPDILIMSVDAWQRLSAEEQVWVQEAAIASSRFQRELWSVAESEALDTMEASGLRIVRGMNTEPFRERVKAMYDDPAFSSPEVRQLIERIRAVGKTS